MPASALAIHPEALLEAEADLAFYAARSPAAGVRLLAEPRGPARAYKSRTGGGLSPDLA